MGRGLVAEPQTAWRIRVVGTVQGVGFRPFVYRLATALRVTGRVYNAGDAVEIVAEGAPAALRRLVSALRQDAPPGAVVRAVSTEPIPALGHTRFRIVDSVARPAGGSRGASIPPDIAVCDACLAEVRDPAARRYRYPFVSCTACGPRYTVVEALPYDRERTTLAVFPLCPACRTEYDDPAARWFDAQTMACPRCGPTVRWQGPEGVSFGEEALAAAVACVAAGGIAAVKGVGGYHLMADATRSETVERLRRLKQRGNKPFAVMVRTLEAAAGLVRVDAEARTWLQSWRRPIVLLPRRPDAPVADAVAPGLDTLGVFLPYTALHALLLDDLAAALGREPVVVLTSGNVSDEPMVYREDVAVERLRPIVDGWLHHNRAIVLPVDDSVVRPRAGPVQILRRSRGFVPEAILLPVAAPEPIAALGGHLKNVVAVVRRDEAFLGQHIGDLDHPDARDLVPVTVARLAALAGVTPRVVVHDLHPDYATTLMAPGFSPAVRLAVQHHHAHLASVLAEHGRTEPVLGVAADGSGFGPDGTVWGGELLLASLGGYRRLAHFAPFALPGGSRAIREPWRMAAWWLDRLLGEDGWGDGDPWAAWRGPWERMRPAVARGVATPRTSSLGRLFDVAAALVGLGDRATYEGELAVRLEVLARTAADCPPLPETPDPWDPAPLLRALAVGRRAGVDPATLALLFHRGIAENVRQAVRAARGETGLDTVALSGGVFQNVWLVDTLTVMLRQDGFTVLTNERVPAGDGGLALGQAAVAAWGLRHGFLPDGGVTVYEEARLRGARGGRE